MERTIGLEDVIGSNVVQIKWLLDQQRHQEGTYLLRLVTRRAAERGIIDDTLLRIEDNGLRKAFIVEVPQFTAVWLQEAGALHRESRDHEAKKVFGYSRGLFAALKKSGWFVQTEENLAFADAQSALYAGELGTAERGLVYAYGYAQSEGLRGFVSAQMSALYSLQARIAEAEEMDRQAEYFLNSASALVSWKLFAEMAKISCQAGYVSTVETTRRLTRCLEWAEKEKVYERVDQCKYMLRLPAVETHVLKACGLTR